MSHRPQIILGISVLAAALIATAFLVLREPQNDPARLLAALDAFTGEWAGDASIQSSEGKPLRALHMERRYSWVGEKQIVETRFTDGDQQFFTRAIQWIEAGQLKAVGIGPATEADEFAGAPTADGILWTNRLRAKADRLDRIVTQDGRKTLQTASISALRLGDLSDVVGIAAVLLPHKGEEPSTVAAIETTPDPATRVAELEIKLAVAEMERDQLRARLEQTRTTAAAENAPKKAEAKTATPTPVVVAPPRPNQFEIRSSPAGMLFEVRREDEANLISGETLFAGTTPVTLTSVPPGNYAVIIQREGQRKTVHHVTVHESADLFLFHREDGAAIRTPAAPAIDVSPAPTPLSSDATSPTQTPP
jgi:hypothetical protein